MSERTDRAREIAERYKAHPLLAPLANMVAELSDDLDVSNSVIVALSKDAGLVSPDTEESVRAGAAADPGSTAVMTPLVTWLAKAGGKVAHAFESTDGNSACNSVPYADELADVEPDHPRCGNCTKALEPAT